MYMHARVHTCTHVYTRMCDALPLSACNICGQSYTPLIDYLQIPERKQVLFWKKTCVEKTYDIVLLLSLFFSHWNNVKSQTGSIILKTVHFDLCLSTNLQQRLPQIPQCWTPSFVAQTNRILSSYTGDPSITDTGLFCLRTQEILPSPTRDYSVFVHRRSFHHRHGTILLTSNLKCNPVCSRSVIGR